MTGRVFEFSLLQFAVVLFGLIGLAKVNQIVTCYVMIVICLFFRCTNNNRIKIIHETSGSLRRPEL